MKKPARILLYLGLTALSTINVSAKTPLYPTRYTTEDKLYALSTLWSELKYNFVNIDRIAFDLDSLYQATIPQVLATKNDVAYFDVLKRFIARFEDGHTAIRKYSYKWNDVFDYAPIFFEELDGKYYISRLWESSGLDSLALGSELTQIDGMPTRQYAEQNYLPVIAHGSLQTKLSLAANEIGTGVPGSDFRGTIKRPDGNCVSFCIPNNYNQLQTRNRLGNAWAWSGFRKPRHAPVTLEWLEDKIAWLDFRSFHNNDIPAIDSLMSEIKQRASGLVIDLRFCPGGSSLVGDRLLQYIVDADYCLSGVSRTRISNGYGRSQGNYRPEYEAFYQGNAYETMPADTIPIDRTLTLKCPIVILTDKHTASAAETFLVRLYELPARPLIIGRQTEGSTGAPLVIDLPHDAYAVICTLQHCFPVSGKKFDREGIVPDMKIIPTVDDYLTGRDRAMDKALQVVKGIELKSEN